MRVRFKLILLDNEKVAGEGTVKLENGQEKNKKNLSLFLDHFLGRVLVFLFSYFLVFFYKFPPQNWTSFPCPESSEKGQKSKIATSAFKGKEIVMVSFLLFRLRDSRIVQI